MTPIGIQLSLGGEREVEAGLRRVGGSMDTVGTAANALTRAVGGMAGAFAGALSVREFVQAADAVTSLQNQLKLATGSAQAAGFAYNQLYEISQRSRTGFVELGKTFASISTAAADLGVSQQRLLSVTEAIGNAVTISGTGAQAAQAALMQLGQGLASGTLRGEELNSVMEQTPRLAKALADGLGVTRGELRALGAQGAITADQVIKALESQSSVLQGEVKDATLTVGQAFTQLQNSAVMAVGEFDRATGATGSLAQAIGTLAGAVDGLGGVIRDNEGAFKVLGGTLAGAAVIAGAAGVVKSIGLISGAIATLGAVLLANPAVLGLLGVGAVAGAGLALVSAQSKTASGIEQAIARLQSENERSEAAMARATAGGRLAGADNIAKTIESRRDQIAKLRAEQDALNPNNAGAGGGRGSVNPQSVGAAIAEQGAQEKELAAIRQKLYGVDKDYLPTLTKLHAQYAAGNLTLEQYRDMVGKLAEANFKKEKSGGGAAKALREEQNAYEQLISSINVKIAQEREELAGGGALTDSQKMRIKLDQEMAAGKLTLTAAHKASVTAAIDELALVERQQKAAAAVRFYDAERLEIQGELNAAYVSESKSRESGRQAINEYARGIQESNDFLQLEISLMGQSERARNIALEQYRIELELKKQIAAIDANPGFESEDQREVERAKARSFAAIATANASSRVFLDDWKKSVEQYEGIFRNGFADMLNNGKDGWKSFTQSLVTTFKTTVADQLYKMFAQPFVVKIIGSLMGLVGGGGAGGALDAVAGGASGGGGLLNMLSMGKNAYSLYSGGLSGLTAPGSMYYNLATSGVGQGLGLSNAAPILGNNVSAFAPAGTQLTSPFSGGMSAAGGAGVFAAVVGIVLNALGAFKSERKIGSGLMGTLGKGDLQPWEEWREGGTLFSGPSFSTMNPVQELAARRKQLQDLKDNGQGGTQQAATLQIIVDNLENLYGDLADQAAAQSKAIQTAYDGLRKNVGDMADVLGISSDAVRAFTTQLGGSGKGLNFEGLSADEIQAKVTEALATANNELAQQIIGKFVTTTTTGTRIVSENVGSQGEDQNIVYSEVEQTNTSTRYVESEYAREGEEAIDTLTRLATSLSTVNDVFETLGITLLDASLSGGDAASALADAFGGLDRLVAVTQDYYQNFYTDDERKAQMQGRLDKQFAELGIATPKNRDEFRKLADDALEQVEVQRANRASLTQGLASTALTVGKGGFTPADLNRLGIGASLADGPANPELEGKLSGFLSGLNELAGKGLDPEAMQTGIAALVDLNGEVLGIGKDANETAAAILGLSGTFAELNESAADAQARIERERAKAQDEAYSNFRRAIARDRDALNEQADALRTSINSTRSAVDLLRGSTADMYATVDSTAQLLAAQGMVYIEQALAGVRSGGKLSDYTGLSDAVSATRDGLGRGVYATDFERRRDTLVWAGQFKALADAGDMQLTVEERQLKGINDQLEALNKLDKRAEQLVNGTLELTETVDVYFDRLLAIMAPPDKGDTRPERLNGGNGEAVFGGSNPGTATGGGGASSPYKRPVSLGTAGTGYQPVVDADEVKKLNTLAPDYHKYDGTGDGRGLMTSMIGSGATAKDLEALSGMYAADWVKFAESLGLTIPAYAGGGMHAGGLRVVGERGWEIEATGPARYWNQQQLGQAMASGGGASDALAQEVRLLREEVAALRGATEATAKNTSGMNQMAEQFDKVTNGGNALRNKAIA